MNNFDKRVSSDAEMRTGILATMNDFFTFYRNNILKINISINHSIAAMIDQCHLVKLRVSQWMKPNLTIHLRN